MEGKNGREVQLKVNTAETAKLRYKKGIPAELQECPFRKNLSVYFTTL